MSIFKRWINKKAESSILRFFVYNVFNRLVILELACNDGLPDKAGQLLLVIDILVLLLNAEHGGFPRTVAGTEKHMPRCV